MLRVLRCDLEYSLQYKHIAPAHTYTSVVRPLLSAHVRLPALVTRLRPACAREISLTHSIV